MKLVWIFDPPSDKEALEFLALMIRLNMGMFWRNQVYPNDVNKPEDLLAYFKRNRYNGRLAIWAGIHAYPECCGLSILSQPKFGFEFRAQQRLWPQEPAEILTAQGDSLYDSSKAVIYVSVSKSMDNLREQITDNLAENIGLRGAYLISDYADGKGQLWPFVDEFMPRKCFSLEPAVSFLNGNTGKRLGTWVARNTTLRGGYDFKGNTPFATLSDLKQFGTDIPSTYDRVMGAANAL